jgi:hypothetical protein
MPDAPYFTERQRFRQPWLWLLIGGVAVLFWYGAWQQIVLGRPWGTNPAPDGVLILVVLLAGVAVPWLFLAGRLDTEVRDDGIHVRFFPFHRKPRVYAWADIESVEARVYSPLGEYGGWGIRYGFRGKAYNVSGNLGVELRLRGGWRVLIGTRDPAGFTAAIEAATSSPRR